MALLGWMLLLVPQKTGLLAHGRKNAGNRPRFSIEPAPLFLFLVDPSSTCFPIDALLGNAFRSFATDTQCNGMAFLDHLVTDISYHCLSGFVMLQWGGYLLGGNLTNLMLIY